MDSYNLAFEEEELLESLNNNQSYIESKDRKAWLSNYPSIVLEIDQQIRKYFEINNCRKLVFSIYNFQNNNILKIHKEKENVLNRVVITTSSEELRASNGKVYKINPWEAYILPEKFRSKTDIYFQKKLKQKNKFRTNISLQKKDRYILIFEYIFNNSEIDNILNNFQKDKDVDETVEEFLSP